MTMRRLASSSRAARPGRTGLCAAAALATLTLAACGGGTPLSNPPTLSNPAGATGQRLSFAYFQRCVNPILIAQLQVNQGGVISSNSCAGAGCHDDRSGTGGAFRVRAGATPVDLATASTQVDAVRQTDMYRNFISSQSEVVFNDPLASRLLTKPLVQGVLHGGGLIFPNTQDPNVRRILFWISRPMPAGQDEFSPAAASLFANGDPINGDCLSP